MSKNESSAFRSFTIICLKKQKQNQTNKNLCYRRRNLWSVFNQFSFQLKDGPGALKSMVLRRSEKLDIVCAYSLHSFLLYKPWRLLWTVSVHNKQVSTIEKKEEWGDEWREGEREERVSWSCLHENLIEHNTSSRQTRKNKSLSCNLLWGAKVFSFFFFSFLR